VISPTDPMLAQSIRLHEGFSSRPYLCTAGALTIGYGRNLDSHPPDPADLRRWEESGCTDVEAEQMLVEDIADALDAAAGYAWFDRLSDAAQRVVVEMIFQLGAAGFGRFRHLRTALEARDYQRAAHEMRDSKWARSDTPARAEALARRMESEE